MWHENFNLTEIKTPIDVNKYKDLLIQANYPKKKREYLVDGFKNGFALNFTGDRKVKRLAPNLKLRVGSKIEIWNKVMKEIAAGRYAGPYEEPPFEYFIQSHIGLVPKDKGKKTRLIFHLSYPRDSSRGMSVNVGIPKERCTVSYPDFDEAVQMCLKELDDIDSEHKHQVKMGKLDMSMAFRHVPIRVAYFMLLVLKCEHPVTGKIYYMVDKCLPFGSSISCAIFQDISDSIAYLVSFRTNKPTLNYLDDYFFAACNQVTYNKSI